MTPVTAITISDLATQLRELRLEEGGTGHFVRMTNTLTSILQENFPLFDAQEFKAVVYGKTGIPSVDVRAAAGR